MVILALDLGDARTGVAVCDKSELISSPAGVIHESSHKKLIEKIKALIDEKKPELIVLGLPVNMDGTHGERAEKSKAFAETLRELTGLDVELWDERMTTVAAHKALNVTNTRGKKRKNTVDTVAAVMILQSYMDYRKNK